MPRVVNDVENARQMEERTNAQQVAPSVREKSVRIADESEVENRLGSARSMLRKLSKEMCDCVTISDGSTRLFRQFEAFWEDKIVALTQSIAEYSPEIQRKIRLVAAERDKISKEMEDAIEANELEEQLTLLQRCTRQLEAIRISENPDKVLQEKLCGLLFCCVVYFCCPFALRFNNAHSF